MINVNDQFLYLIYIDNKITTIKSKYHLKNKSDM